MRKCLMLLAVFAAVGSSQDISGDLPYISVDVRREPVAPLTTGGYVLQYELFVTNWYDKDITIRAVDILAGDVLVQRIEGEVIKGLFAIGTGQTAVVGPRQTTTLVLSGVANNLPTKLDHRIHFGIAGDSQDTVVRYPGTPVHKDVVHLRPPLRGDSWVALEGPGGNNHHTAGILQFEGRNLVPQRFAIDFARSYDDGQLFHDDREDVHSYRGYGAEVLAVADGRVVFVRDDVPDNTGQAKANREWLRIHDLCRSEVPALAWYKGVIARRWAEAANLEWSSRCPVALVDPRLTQHLEGNDRRPNKREFLYAAI